MAVLAPPTHWLVIWVSHFPSLSLVSPSAVRE